MIPIVSWFSLSGFQSALPLAVRIAGFVPSLLSWIVVLIGGLLIVS